MTLNKKIILIPGILLIGVLSGIAGGVLKDRFYPSQIETTKLPLEIVSNRNVTLLYANANGKVIAKKESDFTIEKDGHQVTIYLDNVSKNLTSFYQMSSTGSAQLNFSDISIADSMEGGISVSISKRNLDKSPLTLVAHRFKVDKTNK